MKRATLQTNYPNSREKRKHFRETNVWKNMLVLSHSLHTHETCLLSAAAAVRSLTAWQKQTQSAFTCPKYLKTNNCSGNAVGKCHDCLSCFRCVCVCNRCGVSACCQSGPPPLIRPHTYNASFRIHQSISGALVCETEEKRKEKCAPKWKTMAIHTVMLRLLFSATINNNKNSSSSSRAAF